MLVMLAMLSCVGCSPRTTAPSGDHLEIARQQLQCGGPVMQKLYPQGSDDRLDLLFVLDTSPSMAPHRQRVIEQLPAMIEAMKNRGNGYYPDLRVAVISADLGAPASMGCSAEGDGARPLPLPRGAACPMPSEAWLSLDLMGETNMVGGSTEPGRQIAEALTCMMQVEVGCALQQPLEAMRRALDPEQGTLKAMRRPGARLKVVVITDKDDCSIADPAFLAEDGTSLALRCLRAGTRCAEDLESPGEKSACEPEARGLHPLKRYLSFFDTPELRDASLVFIRGPADPLSVESHDGLLTLGPSCHADGHGALPAPRLGAFEEQRRWMTEFVSICEDSFVEALSPGVFCLFGSNCIDAGPLDQRCEPTCLDGQCDLQALPGVDCVVHEVFYPGLDKERVEPLTRCPAELFDPEVESCGTHCPCWRIVHDDADCTPDLGVQPLKLDVMRAFPRFAPRVVTLTCSAPDGYEPPY